MVLWMLIVIFLFSIRGLPANWATKKNFNKKRKVERIFIDLKIRPFQKFFSPQPQPPPFFS